MKRFFSPLSGDNHDAQPTKKRLISVFSAIRDAFTQSKQKSTEADLEQASEKNNVADEELPNSFVSKKRRMSIQNTFRQQSLAVPRKSVSGPSTNGLLESIYNSVENEQNINQLDGETTRLGANPEQQLIREFSPSVYVPKTRPFPSLSRQNSNYGSENGFENGPENGFEMSPPNGNYASAYEDDQGNLVRPPFISLNPRERYQLLQMKRSVEASEFLQSRLKYMVDPDETTSVHRPQNKVDSSTQTYTQEHLQKSLNFASARTLALKRRQQRKTKRGTGFFSGEFFYEPKVVEPPKQVDSKFHGALGSVAKPQFPKVAEKKPEVLFADAESRQKSLKRRGSVSSRPGLEDALRFGKPKETLDEDEATSKISTTFKFKEQPLATKASTVGPSSGFKFDVPSEKISAILDSSTKGEKAPADAEKNADTNLNPPASLFGSVDSKLGDGKPSLFGSSGSGSILGSFGSAKSTSESQEKAEKPAISFSFGKAPAAAGDSEKDAPKKPLFGSASSNEPDAKKPPAFSFGQKPESAKAAPAFSFGKPADSGDAKAGDSSDSKPDGGSKPAFSFSKKPDSDGAKPAFSFGQKADNGDAKPAFSFGQKPESDAAKPSLFGDQAEKKDATPAFSFGGKADAKPAFAFGSAAPSTDKAPAFSFGKSAAPTGDENDSSGKSTEPEKSQAKPAPKFNFGSLSQGSVISDSPDSRPSTAGTLGAFAASNEKEKEKEKDDGDEREESQAKRKAPGFAANPLFSAGGTPSFSAEKAKDSTPGTGGLFGSGSALTPGANENADTPSPQKRTTNLFSGAEASKPQPEQEKSAEPPKFSFGQPAAAAKDAPKFSFGATPAEAPKFSFGQTSAPAAAPASVADAPKFSFGAGEKAAPAATDASRPEAAGLKRSAPTAFSFGGSNTTSSEPTPAPSFAFANPNVSQPAGNSSAFSFGASATADPASIFGGGGSSAPTPAFSFSPAPGAAPAAPAPAFGAAPSAPGFSFSNKAVSAFGGSRPTTPANPGFGAPQPPAAGFGGFNNATAPSSVFGGASRSTTPNPPSSGGFGQNPAGQFNSAAPQPNGFSFSNQAMGGAAFNSAPGSFGQPSREGTPPAFGNPMVPGAPGVPGVPLVSANTVKRPLARMRQRGRR